MRVYAGVLVERDSDGMSVVLAEVLRGSLTHILPWVAFDPASRDVCYVNADGSRGRLCTWVQD